MNMTDRTDSTQAPTLRWVCTPSGWALGWAHAPQPLIEQPWAQGRPPADFPEDEWSIGLIQALGDMASDRGVVDVWCSLTAPQPKPDWWPDSAQGRKRWRAWLRAMDCRLGESRSIESEPDPSALWDTVATLRVEAGANPPTGPRRWSLMPTPGRPMLISGVAALAVHAAVVWVLEPALALHRQQQQALAEAAWAAEQQQKSEQRALARVAEQAQRRQQWQAHQTLARQPLEQLAHLLEAARGVTQPQFWAELRYADGAWTIFGVASHESAWHEAVAQSLSPWQPQTLESAPGVWPPPPAAAWPAWRFQARVQNPQRQGASP